MINFNLLKNILLGNNSFLLTSHVNPDADAIGSEIALSKMLLQLGKDVHIVNHSSTPYNLQFLDDQKIIKRYEPDKHKILFDKVDVLVALDFNRADRMVSMAKDFNESTKLKICIDHHQQPQNFVDHLFVDTEYSATAHILFDLIKQTNICNLTKEIADPIYAAIMTDTGSFRFERTNAELHRIAAELLDCGVNPGDIYNKIYDECKLSKLSLLGRTLNTLKLIGKNKIGYMEIYQSDFTELNALESDTDSFVNYTLSVENVILGMLFIELKNGFKVSFRSKGSLPANILAEEFDGGGHTNAAGARFHNLKMKEMIPDILRSAEKFLEKYSQE